MRATVFAKRLTEYRDLHQWTNAGLAEHLSRKVNRTISVRTLEGWLQGRRPHLIWRKMIETTIQ